MFKILNNRNKMIIQLVTFLVLLQYSAAQIGCPAINCPANCDVVKGPNGCNHCACSQGSGEQNICSAVPSCPQSCRQDIGQDGCPICQCGNNGILCAAVPSCLLGCLNHNNVTGCYTCDCFPSPLPGAASRSLEVESTGSLVNSRQRRQLRQGPPLRRVRPNFTPGFAQFGAGQLPFRNRRPVFSSGSFGVAGRPAFSSGSVSVAGRPAFSTGSFSVAGSRCQPVNCQQGCRTAIDLIGCRQCVCGQANVFCPSVPACYGSCIRKNPNTGCSECTCSLAGVSTLGHQTSTHSIVTQQNGAHILPSTSVIRQNAHVSPNVQATQTIGRPPGTTGFNIPTNGNAFNQQHISSTHLRPAPNVLTPQSPALNHGVTVNENVPLGQDASTFSQVSTVQQGIANPGIQQHGAPNVHLSQVQPGSSIQHTLTNQHVTTNVGSVPLTSTLGNPVPTPQAQHLGNSVPVQGTNINSAPALHSTTIEHTLPNQHLPTNAATIPGTSTGQIQLSSTEKHVQAQNIHSVGHLNPANGALVTNQQVPVSTGVVTGTTSSQTIPLGVPGSIQQTHHFQSSVPVGSIHVSSFPAQHNPIPKQEVASIALNPGKALNTAPLKSSGGPGSILQISKDESVGQVKHLTHAHPLIQVSFFSPTNNPVSLIPEKHPQPIQAKESGGQLKPSISSPPQEPSPPNDLPGPSNPVVHIPSKILPHTDLTIQPELPHPVNLEPLHPVEPLQPQKPFLPKVPPQPVLTLHPELLYQEKPLHPQDPFPPKPLPKPEWTPQPESESLIKITENLISPIPEKTITIKPIAKPFPPPPHPIPINPPQGTTKEPYKPVVIPHTTVKPFVPPKDPKPTTKDPLEPDLIQIPAVKPFVPPKEPKPTTKDPLKPDAIPIPTVKPFVPPEDPKPTKKDPYKPDDMPSQTPKPFAPPQDPKPTTKDPHKPDEMPSPTPKPFVPPKDPKPTTKDPHKPDEIPNPTEKPFVPPTDPKPTTKEPNKPDKMTSPTAKPFVPPKDPKPTTKDPNKPEETPIPTAKPFVPPKDPKPTTKDPNKPDEMPSSTIKPSVPPVNPKPINPSKTTTTPAPLIPTSSELSAPKGQGGNNSGKWVWVDE